MKKIINTIALLLIAVAVSAQTAREVLDKTAKTLSNKGGITASFSIKNGAAGTISVKGKKFQATTPDGIVWFNGKTQWTYVKQNSEVNVNNPTDAELQAINPYNFVYIYRNGYKAELKDAGNLHQIPHGNRKRQGYSRDVHTRGQEDIRAHGHLYEKRQTMDIHQHYKFQEGQPLRCHLLL